MSDLVRGDDEPVLEKFPCEECGASLTYAPGELAQECQHCGTRNEIAFADSPWGSGSVAEQDLKAALSNKLDEAEMEETQTVDCDACGAEFEFDAKTHAGECPFCASTIVTETHANRHIKPKGVLPFELAERDAREAMNKWLGSLWFAPSGLSEYARAGRPMQGLYVPYWTYDAETESDYSGRRGDVYYVTKRVTVMVDGKAQTQTRQVPKTRWTPKSGRVRRFFDDVLVLASKSLPKKYADRLGPWDLSALKPYQAAYLAGFRAEAYTVKLDEGFAEARAIMGKVILRDVRFDIGGDKQQVDHIDTRLSAMTFKHILLPVWMAAYKYRGETYRFIVNGRTGNVQGERPYSTWKIAVAVIIGLIVAGAVGFFVAQNQ
ncbi:MAG: primosomal protein N' (replication factor Y) - superfamily II helicase [Pseudomonadota bacterium]